MLNPRNILGFGKQKYKLTFPKISFLFMPRYSENLSYANLGKNILCVIVLFEISQTREDGF